MTTGPDSAIAENAGASARHVPVLAARVVELLAPRAGSVIIDATFGAGGYTRAILSAAACTVIGIDRDPTAIARGADLVAAAGGRLVLAQERFSNLARVAAAYGHAGVDAIALDLGVSSMQLDTPQRGFSFRLDGPLDMRMGGEGPSAADIVAAASAGDLARIIATLGEERHARRVARAIVAARGARPIATTRALADIVARVVRAGPGIHPATRTFQALRLFVNDELGELARALAAAERVLLPGGRLVVVSFHSLEDRIVKTFLATRGRDAPGSRHAPQRARPALTFRPLTRRAEIADAAEIARNPRARSAKLRAAERLAAPAIVDAATAGGERLPSMSDIARGR
ncbi:MAG: 16S rRNA (cytosine(1402)-N(4))-methyltransferase RsmH [Proteobacteria bacterium]|nr:16S rRNA (cytosine(1402)-N(4))-methyltransferase RsmH [Pseudomonadota bacterium]